MFSVSCEVRRDRALLLGKTPCQAELTKNSQKLQESKIWGFFVELQWSNKSWTGFLILHHLLTNFDIQRYQREPKFAGAYSRNNLPNTLKYWMYVVNLDMYT